VIAWAALRQRAWFQHGSALPVVPDPGSLTPSMELRTQDLPSPDEWQQARTVAGAMLGITAAAYLTAPAVADFVGQVTAKARELGRTAPDLVTAVRHVDDLLGIGGGDRLRTAEATAAFVQRLPHLSGVRLVQAVAAPDLAGATPAAAGKSLASAGAVAEALTRFAWQRLEPLRAAMNGEGDRAASAAEVVNAVKDALERDELVSGAAAALSACEEGIFTWLAAAPPGPAPVPGPGPVVVPVPGPGPGPIQPPSRSGRASRVSGGGPESVLRDLKAFLEAHPNETVEVSWQVVP
jgi:hypothetical protein